MGIARSFAFHIADYNESLNIERLGKATLKSIKILATSRRVEPYANTFDELINQTVLSELSSYKISRPIPWARELININLRDKILRGAELEMPVEFTIYNKNRTRYDRLN